MCLTLCAIQAPNLREKALLGGRNALSDAFVSVVARGLEKSAAMRFRTADALADAARHGRSARGAAGVCFGESRGGYCQDRWAP